MNIASDLRSPSAGSPLSLFTSVALLSIALGIGATRPSSRWWTRCCCRLPVKNPISSSCSTARNHYGNNSGGNMLSFPI